MMRKTSYAVLVVLLASFTLWCSPVPCRANPCPDCQNSPHGPGKIACPSCGGGGVIAGPVLNGLQSYYGCGACGGWGGGGSPGGSGRGWIACATCGGTGQVESPEEKEAKQRREEARAALDQGRYADAENLYRRVIELKPTTWDWNNLGVAIGKQDSNRWQDRKRCFEKALELDPDNETAGQNLERLNEWRGQVEEWERRQEQQRQRKEEQERRRKQLIDLWERGADAYQQERYGAAESAWREYIALDPAAGAYNELGNALDRQGRDREAMAAYQQAIARGSQVAARNMDRTQRRMQQAQEKVKPVAQLEDSLHVPAQLADQGAFGQLLDVQYHSTHALSFPLTPLVVPRDPMSDEARKGFDTIGHHQRGRLVPGYSPPPAVAANSHYQETITRIDAAEHEIQIIKEKLFDPQITRAECEKAVRDISALRSQSIAQRFEKSVMEDPKSLPVKPPPAARASRRHLSIKTGVGE